MENLTQNQSPVARAIPVILFAVGLMVIYYLYQYLFGPSTANEYVLVANQKPANVQPNAPITVTTEKLPKLYEGGEFTVSSWFYVSNWSYRAGMNKSIFRLGGPNMDTIRIYLGGQKPKLHVRLQTRDAQLPLPTGQNSSPDLSVATLNQTFNQLQPDSGLLDDSQSCDLTPSSMSNTFTKMVTPPSSETTSSPMCDLPAIDLQRWVHLTVAVNGRTVDVYLDGKLSRSCVLPSSFKVDSGGYSAYLLSYGGFGGFIGRTSMYDSALHPEAVYRIYHAGPEPITSFGDWLGSIFKFGVNISVDTK
jgi:hypothetical protein